ncbi:MAG: GntR family transcriptional regulator [Candidatus Dormibacteraeota bacterium]|nr:GntR family transcriptional regulator [Candidatus Dormibacteraeota bacterium]
MSNQAADSPAVRDSGPPPTAEPGFEAPEPLELITAVDVAYRGIRAAILSGEFEPGMQLKLQSLGDRYSISLIPVREALRLLQAEGLVESVRNKGARVAPISLAETLDVYRLRLVLETEALKLAYPHIDQQLVETLEHCQQEMRSIFDTDPVRYLALHQKLHFGLYSRCGSKWTLRMLGLVWSHSERWRRLALPTDVDAPTEDHTAILEALKRSDSRAAGKALEHHIQLSTRSLQRALRKERPDGRA